MSKASLTDDGGRRTPKLKMEDLFLRFCIYDSDRKLPNKDKVKAIDSIMEQFKEILLREFRMNIGEYLNPVEEDGVEAEEEEVKEEEDDSASEDEEQPVHEPSKKKPTKSTKK